MEQKVLKSTEPLDIDADEMVTAFGNQRGYWLNKSEVNEWRGDLPISRYPINQDSKPQVISKRSNRTLQYVQELAIRYLRPPTPPPAGSVVIVQEPDLKTGPAPPVVIRVAAARPETPAPLIVREAPPKAPEPVGVKRITISGRRLPAPARKVVIERLAPIPAKPQPVIVERWLPYKEQKRRVVYHKARPVSPITGEPRNVIVQWEAPRPNVRKQIKYLGVVRASPSDYVHKYGENLWLPSNLPNFVLDIKTPGELGPLAAEYKPKVHQLCGDLDALKLIDLNREGLTVYRSQLSL